MIAAGVRAADGSVTFFPLGHLCTDNPFRQYTPPAEFQSPQSVN